MYIILYMYMYMMYIMFILPCSFIRLCDYLVVTMLHSLTVDSCAGLLSVLQSQLLKAVEVTDIVKTIPDNVEEQEKVLQVRTYTIHPHACTMYMYMYVVNFFRMYCTCVYMYYYIRMPESPC